MIIDMETGEEIENKTTTPTTAYYFRKRRFNNVESIENPIISKPLCGGCGKIFQTEEEAIKHKKEHIILNNT